MIVLLDERNSEQIKTCENCKQEKLGRYIQAVGFSQESRGSFFICFDCQKPRLFWKRNERGMTIFSPVEFKEKNGQA